MTRTADVETKGLDYLTRETAEHVLTVLHDDGLYRHLKFAKPGTGIWRIDVITWPGHLAVSGDLPSYTFARVPDMFEFFRSQDGYVDLSYWSQKIVSDQSRGRSTHMHYEPKKAVQFLQTSYGDAVEGGWDDGLWTAMERDLLPWADTEDMFRAELDAFRYPIDVGPVKERQFEFYDTWENDFREYDLLYVVLLHAIVKIINLYDASKTEAAVAS